MQRLSRVMLAVSAAALVLLPAGFRAGAGRAERRDRACGNVRCRAGNHGS